MKPTRDGYGQGLIVLGEKNPDVVVLCADLTESTRAHWFRDKYPDRFFGMGVAEQDMFCTAAGLALAGKIPYASTFGIFASGRAWDAALSATTAGSLQVVWHFALSSVLACARRIPTSNCLSCLILTRRSLATTRGWKRTWANSCPWNW